MLWHLAGIAAAFLLPLLPPRYQDAPERWPTVACTVPEAMVVHSLHLDYRTGLMNDVPIVVFVDVIKDAVTIVDYEPWQGEAAPWLLPDGSWELHWTDRIDECHRVVRIGVLSEYSSQNWWPKFVGLPGLPVPHHGEQNTHAMRLAAEAVVRGVLKGLAQRVPQ